MQKKENFAASKEYVEKFEAAMEDDANTADAVSAVFELVKFINVNSSEQNSKRISAGTLSEIRDLV